ncbi:PREDICTED: testisin-like [Elephantulus edwardii]|uniref:testisin-like n=1 Tax=Elephantulus edwardii TaxID=28737 RepID=UPI0003F0DB4E|nr:PREDICTED: testisin-like [Elephantulus edwardii]
MDALLLWLLLSQACLLGLSELGPGPTTPGNISPLVTRLQNGDSPRSGKWTMLSAQVRVGLSMAAPCGIRNVSTRIVGGKTSKLGAWPWQGSLRLHRRHTCGASLLNHRWVLTASHCFKQDSRDPRHWNVQFGEQTSRPSLTSLQAYFNRYQVERIVLKSGVSGSSHDIALLKLSSPVTFKKNIQPICVVNSTLKFQHRTDCWVTGWGKTKEHKELGYPYYLQEVQIAIIDSRRCDLMFSLPSFRALIKGGMLCAGAQEGGKDACSGDSGGPLVCEDSNVWYQIGIVSWGVGCGQPNRPGVYTNVSMYFQWMQRTMDHGQSRTDPSALLLLVALLWAPL